jgi:hypothetical protein
MMRINHLIMSLAVAYKYRSGYFAYRPTNELFAKDHPQVHFIPYPLPYLVT